MTGFDSIAGGNRVMAILRGLPPAETAALANRVWDAGIRLVEVPIASPDAVAALREAVRAGAERGLRVGAGTVVTPAQVRAAAEAGAEYTVAPGLDLTVLSASLAAGLPHLPGVATPTEIQLAYKAGCRWMKAFPAGALGTGWLRAVHGPFPDVEFVATGGLRVADVAGFLDAGARVVALGAALADPDQLASLAGVLRQAP
jgi:2-dehydro-3-deoxyphosphogluconate aldolase / (4S)-4-hydroxy-2-oxoglutarate aldolase